MTTRIITTYEDFLAIKDDWNDCLANSMPTYPFLRHEWFDAMIQSFDGKLNLCIQTVWDDGRLMLVAPMHKKRLFGVRELRYIETAASPECRFFRRIHWFPIQPSQVAKTDVFLERNFYCGSNKSLWLDAPKSIIDLHGWSWPDYLAAQSKRTRRYFLECQKKLELAGDCKFLACSNPFMAEHDLAHMINISNLSWRKSKGLALADNKQELKFLEQLLPVGTREGFIETIFLTVNNSVVAYDLYLKEGNNYWGLRSEYDARYWHIVPGTNLKIYLIKKLLATGERACIDLGQGMQSYKMRLANRTQTNHTIYVALTKLGEAYIAALKLKRKVKQLWVGQAA